MNNNITIEALTRKDVHSEFTCEATNFDNIVLRTSVELDLKCELVSFDEKVLTKVPAVVFFYHGKILCVIVTFDNTWVLVFFWGGGDFWRSAWPVLDIQKWVTRDFQRSPSFGRRASSTSFLEGPISLEWSNIPLRHFCQQIDNGFSWKELESETLWWKILLTQKNPLIFFYFLPQIKLITWAFSGRTRLFEQGLSTSSHARPLVRDPLHL